MIYDETRDELIVRSLHRLAQWLRSRPRIDEVFTTFSQSCLVQPYGPTRLTAQEQALVNDPGPGVYVDCLHFDPPFLAHLGSQTEDPDLVAEAITQATGYIRLLYDDDTGLFHHFYLERTRRSHIMGWGRGQGWAILGLLDLVEQLPATNESRAELVTVIGRLADAMRELQRPDGHWFAIVNEPESGSESSTAAFLAAAFWKGIELGILDDRSFGEAAERAWQATIRQLLPDGVLSGVSAAVQSSTAIEHYFHVPTDQLVPWGQGPALLAAARRPGGIGE